MHYPPDIPIEVCDLFLRLAREVKEAHFRRFSADALLHRIRWYFTIESKRVHFKANNNWTPVLARWAMDIAPELHGLFELRVLTSAKVKTITAEPFTATPQDSEYP